MRPFDPNNRASWRRLRRLYYLSLGLLFAVIAFYLGPNRILFGKWTWIQPADFVTVVDRSCVPTVRAMKLYAAKHGRLPQTNSDLGPTFADERKVGYVREGRFEYPDFTRGLNLIRYEFQPKRERWMVDGYFLQGEIPCPEVPTPPTTGP